MIQSELFATSEVASFGGLTILQHKIGHQIGQTGFVTPSECRWEQATALEKIRPFQPFNQSVDFLKRRTYIQPYG